MVSAHHDNDMSIDVRQAGTSLTVRVATRVRGLLGEQNMSRAALARKLGVSKMWVSYRLNASQPFDLNDLEAISQALGVTVADLLPADVRSAVQPTQPYLRKSGRPTDNRPAGHPNGRVDRPVTMASPVRRTRRILHPEHGDIDNRAA